MTNLINERINQIKVKYFGEERGSHKQFIERVGVASNTASNWIKDGYNIGKDVIAKILKTFPDVDAGWLIMREGDMLKSTSSETSLDAIKEQEYKDTIKKLEAEINQLKGENRILREQVDLGERKVNSGKSAR